MIRFIKLLIGIALLIVIIVFGITFTTRNNQHVPLDLLFTTLGEQSVSLWILASFCIGALLMLIVASVQTIPLKMKVRRLESKLRKTKKTTDTNIEIVKNV